MRDKKFVQIEKNGKEMNGYSIGHNRCTHWGIYYESSRCIGSDGIQPLQYSSYFVEKGDENDRIVKIQ